MTNSASIILRWFI